MSREKRVYSELGIYHIMFRGVNKQNVFEEDFDFGVMAKYIKQLKKKYSFELLSYCLMSNHVHLLLKEKNMGDISIIMKCLLTKYAIYYNSKYERRGHLFENRYKSKPIRDNDYLFAALRYIHQNPVKAYLVENMKEYKWSSYAEYVNNYNELADKEFILEIIDINQFKSMHSTPEEEYEPFNEQKQALIRISNHIRKRYGIEPEVIAELPRKDKKEIIIELCENYSPAIIEKITGITRRTIRNYKRVQEKQ